MKTSLCIPKVKFSNQTVTIHYKDGRIQDAILQSNPSTGKTFRYLLTSHISDRRKFPRFPFIKEVKIENKGIRRAIDLSSRGIYVECITPYPVGAILQISFQLGKSTFYAEGRVAFKDPGIGIGLEFCRLSNSMQLRIDVLVQRVKNKSLRDSSKSRRINLDRRNPKENRLPLSFSVPRRRISKDRRNKFSIPKKLIEGDISKVKTIFFTKALPLFKGIGSPVLIEFRDGEEVKAIFYEIPHEPLGFFVELLSNKPRHTLYVLKSAVKHIAHLL